jgi:hypothetical protein
LAQNPNQEIFIIPLLVYSEEDITLDIDSGERPDARSISEKIKTRIIDCDIFLGIFTKRERLGDTDEYATSQWVFEEKTYAVGLNKKIWLNSCFREVAKFKLSRVVSGNEVRPSAQLC